MKYCLQTAFYGSHTVQLSALIQVIKIRRANRRSSPTTCVGCFEGSVARFVCGGPFFAPVAREDAARVGLGHAFFAGSGMEEGPAAGLHLRARSAGRRRELPARAG